ncbi:MAG: hypothetical protein K0U21_05235 [Proteobacteria bacterium]|nr:hypothetical protein [Pseudomonadota bacterium]
MRFLRSLLNSGVFMIVLVAMATLYIAYSTNESGANQSTKEGSSAATAQSSQTEPAPTESTAVTAASAQQPTPVFATEGDANNAFPSSQQDTPPVTDSYGQQAMIPPPMYLPPPPAPVMMAPMPVVPPQAYVPEMQAPAPLLPPPAPPMTLLDQARAALFNGDLAYAEQSYRSLLTTMNDPDLHGELGNVYFAQQHWQAAAQEYALAVDGLGAQGRFAQAQYVLGFLMQIDPDVGQQALAQLQRQLYPQQTTN